MFQVGRPLTPSPAIGAGHHKLECSFYTPCRHYQLLPSVMVNTRVYILPSASVRINCILGYNDSPIVDYGASP